jgi:hypothetical protein
MTCNSVVAALKTMLTVYMAECSCHMLLLCALPGVVATAVTTVCCSQAARQLRCCSL